MSATEASNDGELYTVEASMNEYGALVVRDSETNATYQVVEYRTEALRERIEDLSAGATVRMRLARAGSRANVWIVTSVLPGPSRPAL